MNRCLRVVFADVTLLIGVFVFDCYLLGFGLFVSDFGIMSWVLFLYCFV